jgi:hypothetical protein
MSITNIWTQTLVVDPRSGTNTATAAFHFAGEHVLVQVALCQVSSTSANVRITNVVDASGETRGIDEFLPCVEGENAKLVEVTLGTEGVVAVAVATAFFFDQ